MPTHLGATMRMFTPRQPVIAPSFAPPSSPVAPILVSNHLYAVPLQNTIICQESVLACTIPERGPGYESRVFRAHMCLYVYRTSKKRPFRNVKKILRESS
jgi:hypothetical protein